MLSPKTRQLKTPPEKIKSRSLFLNKGAKAKKKKKLPEPQVMHKKEKEGESSQILSRLDQGQASGQSSWSGASAGSSGSALVV